MSNCYLASRKRYGWIIVCLAAGLLLIGMDGYGSDSKGITKPESSSQEYLKASKENIKWWKEAKFGMFVVHEEL